MAENQQQGRQEPTGQQGADTGQGGARQQGGGAGSPASGAAGRQAGGPTGSSSTDGGGVQSGQGQSVPVSRGEGGRRGTSGMAGMMTPFQEMDRLMQEFFGRRWMQPFGAVPRSLFGELPGMFAGLETVAPPRVDVIDRDEEICVRAELPGVRKEDVQVTLEGRTMTIQAESRREQKQQQENYYWSEIQTGTCTRTVMLPADVNEQEARAEMREGILEVIIPKAEPARRRRLEVR